MPDADRSACSSLYSAPVERPLKERLVGAAVLMAAAVILIPEMLSGPRRAPANAPAPAPAKPDEHNLKRYTIDFEAATAAKEEAPATATVIEEPSPPAEEPVTADPEAQSAVPVATEQSPESPAPAEGTSAGEVAAVTGAPLPVQPVPVEQPPPAAVPAPQEASS